MHEIKPLPAGDVGAALVLAEKSRMAGEPEAADSMCIDVLEVEPENQEALVLLLLARTDLLDRGLPRSVERAREVLPRLATEYAQAYYAGLICERQARYLLSQRGRRSGFVAWEWFRYALDHYGEAARLDPARLEPVLRGNTCVRLVERNRHCVPEEDDITEHGIE